MNSASQQELVALVGIGSERADAIMLARPFKTPADLLSIPGIGPIMLERLEEQGLPVSGGQMPGTAADHMDA